jgi:hypothetical protein
MAPRFLQPISADSGSGFLPRGSARLDSFLRPGGQQKATENPFLCQVKSGLSFYCALQVNIAPKKWGDIWSRSPQAARRVRTTPYRGLRFLSVPEMVQYLVRSVAFCCRVFDHWRTTESKSGMPDKLLETSWNHNALVSIPKPTLLA